MTRFPLESPTSENESNAEPTLTAVMKETLASLFKPYRPILPITAHRNVRMRGQAFVSFSDRENANRARREVNEFPLYGKAMVSLGCLLPLAPLFLLPLPLLPSLHTCRQGDDSFQRVRIELTSSKSRLREEGRT